jgi:ABC-type uncharacterized transport system YnjBCD substrate-binding protein
MNEIIVLHRATTPGATTRGATDDDDDIIKALDALFKEAVQLDALYTAGTYQYIFLEDLPLWRNHEAKRRRQITKQNGGKPKLSVINNLDKK